MFNFLMKPELLPFIKTPNVQHFYQFQGKQIHQKQIEQLKQLQQLSNKIKTLELQQRSCKSCQIINPKQQQQNVEIQSKYFSKSYVPDYNFKNQFKTKTNNTKSLDDFYQKNKKWKENIQAEIIKKKQQKIEQEQKQLSQCRKPFSDKQASKNYSAKENQSLSKVIDSKGPISGWTERFHSYIKKKLPQELKQNFKPTINKKSQIIASRMVGKVQDRLMKFGQIMKVRKHEMMIEEIQKIGKLPNSDPSFASMESSRSDLFHRLYKEAQNTNRKIKSQNQEFIKNEFTYRPKITKLDEEMQKKVKQKRQKSPIYFTKKITKQQTQRLMKIIQKQTGEKIKERDFDNFLRRNQMLLQKRNKNVEKKQKQQVQKVENELKQCTFIPVLNRKSMRMLGRVGNNETLQFGRECQQVQVFDIKQADVPEMQQNAENIWDQKSVSKYSYSYVHSYKDSGLFDNETDKKPLGYQESSNKILNHKIPQCNNAVSQIDSLDFSAEKQLSNIFNKSNLHQQQANTYSYCQNNNNLSPNSNNEILNYQLTFSNKKLHQQLNSFNQPKSSVQRQQTEKQRSNQQNHNNNNNNNKNTFTNSYQQTQQQIKNDWENQLQKVKHRLQNLMKSNKKTK